MANAEVQFTPQSFTPGSSTPPALAFLNGTNVKQSAWLFDDTTEENVYGKFQVPQNIGSGNVTLYAVVSPVTGAASKNVALRFAHVPVADNEAFDAALTAVNSGDKSITATTGNQSIITWTETVANLGWVAGDTVYFKFSRVAASSNNLSGDMRLQLFTVAIPVT